MDNHSFSEHSENICFYTDDKLSLTNLNKKKSRPEDSIIQLRNKRKFYINVNRYSVFS